MANQFALEGIDHVALAVRDLHRSADWYRDVLGLERRHADVWGDYPIMVGRGATMVALFPIQGDAQDIDGSRTRVRMRHLAFRADAANFARAQDALRARSISFEMQDHTISRSIYFNDPDGYEIEITTYELT